MNTFGSIRGEACAVLHVEAVDGFDQPDASNRDQILLIGCGAVVFSDNVGDQAQVVQDQQLAGVLVACGGLLKISLLDLRFERGREGLRRANAENQVKKVREKRKKHGNTSVFA